MKKEKAVPLSVLVVTWNCRDMALACLAALRKHAGDLDLEVVLVDNASSDGTAEAVRERFPETRVVASPENLGFPRANNLALAHATGRNVLYLNPDTEVGPGTLQACLRALEQDPGVGVVGCRLVYPDGSTQYEGGRNPYLLRHVLFETLWLHMLFPRHPVFAHQLMGDWDHTGTRDVEALCGAFMMARREVVEAVGGLPDEVFMYHEDLAFCLRARRAGWRIRYLGDVATTHHGKQSSSRSPAPLALVASDARIRLIREAQGRLHAAAARGVLLLRSLLRLAVSALAILPGSGGLRRRYPAVFDARTHALVAAWSVAPGWVGRAVLPPEMRTR